MIPDDRNELEKALAAAKRKLRIEDSKDSMLPFMQYMRPDPDSDDALATTFVATPLARLLSQIMERVDAGIDRRVCVSVGPQMGKSEILSRGGPAWLSGRKPQRNMILGSYNDGFAKDFGDEVREIMQSQRFRDIFPEHQLRRGSEAKESLKTTRNGKIAFVGIGGSGTGKPADIFFVDDPYRSDEDAQSEAYREKVWKWFTSVSFSRIHVGSSIIIVHTRWHEDDLIGRLVDPDHPERNKKYAGISDNWTYYNLPAIVTDPALAASLGLTLAAPQDPFVVKMFGTKPMAALWEERKSLKLLAEAKQIDSRVFGALYMGSPTPEDGDYFTSDMLQEYDREDLPKNLTKFGASDHATGTKQRNDSTVIGSVGVDADDEIWVLPDLVMDRMETDRTVQEMLLNMKRNRPELWWMESELISKSFGPFLLAEMHRQRIYVTLQKMIPSTDKRTRARAIQGRMSMRKVHFPRFAPWWPEARQQLLKFPYATHDDFVDWLSWVGLGMLQQTTPDKKETPKEAPKVGSIAWMKASGAAKEQHEKRILDSGGW